MSGGSATGSTVDRPAPGTPLSAGPALVVGFGVTGQAVARALIKRGIGVVVVDDRPDETALASAVDLGIELVVAPDAAGLDGLLHDVTAVVPSPGIPEHHPVFGLAASADVPIVGELDLAQAWDDRPCLAITGTDGKTTVTTMVTQMLVASGVAAIDAGNTEVPLVAAIEDPTPEVFVVEASSFRLAPLRAFLPLVGAWLNFAPDHLDVHADLDRYERAKANLWTRFTSEQLAVANADDPVVMAHAAGVERKTTFGLGLGRGTGPRPDWHVSGAALRQPDGSLLLDLDCLPRRFPHDVSNALAASATALGGGATIDGVRSTLSEFRGLPHRVTLVGEADGVRWYDDSKATTPHATLAAVEAFGSVVLIAGGRNKGLDLRSLAATAPKVRGVVAIGEAAEAVARAFDGAAPPVRVNLADSMDMAVAEARRMARPGDAVLLSPGCASFDWYGSYAERGDDFVRAVNELLETSG